MTREQLTARTPGKTPCCAWCGEPLPAQRRGRKGKRAFCGPEHQRAYFAKARLLGALILTETGKPAKDYCSNSGARSGTDEASPPRIH